MRMCHARPTYRMLSVGSLEEDVDEGAALEVVLAEPFVEDVEDRQQLLLGCGAAPFGLCLEPLVRPQLFAAVEESEHEVVLRREMAVAPVAGTWIGAGGGAGRSPSGCS